MYALMSGNEAFARGAYEAGFAVGCGYPGTPSTEILENFVKYPEVKAEWSINEKVALEVGIGASLAGARTLVTMKHVGVNVAADPLFTSSYIGVNGALVIMVADDPNLHSSQNEQDSRHYAMAAKLPMLEPSDSQEAKDFVGKAAELSEAFDTPVFLRSVTRVSHSKSVVNLSNKKLKLSKKNFQSDVQKQVMIPAYARMRHFVVEKRLLALQSFAEEFEINKIELNQGKIGIVTSGLAYQYVKEVLPEADIFKLGMVYPLPAKKLKDFCSAYKTVYVVEELDPIIETQLKYFGINNIQGKSIFPLEGEFSSELIKGLILGKDNKQYSEFKDLKPFNRPPALCLGCPHRQTFNVLNKMGVRVTGDIGCYTLGALPPYNAMHTCVDMGASIPVAHGMELAEGEKYRNNIVAVIGDSTFAHSGITGLINAAYNKTHSLIIILDNSITAMTGMQPNPMNGITLKGEQTVSVNYEKLAEAVGINKSNFKRISAYKEADIEIAIQELLATKQLSLMVVEGPCIIYKRKKQK